MKLQSTALSVFIVVTVFYLLHIGRALIQPIVIAGSSLISSASSPTPVARALQGIRCRNGYPQDHRTRYHIFAIISLLVQLITENIKNVYGRWLRLSAKPGNAHSGHLRTLWRRNREHPIFGEFLGKIDLGTYLQDFGKTVRNLVSRTGIIIVYLLFLLARLSEPFNQRLSSLSRAPAPTLRVFKLIDHIGKDVRLYIGIKVLTSGATALLSYLVMSLIGLDFASFCVLIFLLNFIPTIGSIVATLFPSALALVQFDTLRPFVLVVVAIWFSLPSVA